MGGRQHRCAASGYLQVLASTRQSGGGGYREGGWPRQRGSEAAVRRAQAADHDVCLGQVLPKPEVGEEDIRDHGDPPHGRDQRLRREPQREEVAQRAHCGKAGRGAGTGVGRRAYIRCGSAQRGGGGLYTRACAAPAQQPRPSCLPASLPRAVPTLPSCPLTDDHQHADPVPRLLRHGAALHERPLGLHIYRALRAAEGRRG